MSMCSALVATVTVSNLFLTQVKSCVEIQQIKPYSRGQKKHIKSNGMDGLTAG